MYLGLRIGSDEYVEKFFEDKMSKVESSFYSLRDLGFKPEAMNPRTIAFIYMFIYCQSIMKYSLELFFLNVACLRLLNVRQNFLLKNILGLSHFCRTKPLFQALRIEQVTQLYMKHKIHFLKQITFNDLSLKVFNFFLYTLRRSRHRSTFLYLRFVG